MFSELTYFTAEIVAITSLSLLGLCFLFSKSGNWNTRIFALICLSNVSSLIVRMSYKPVPEFQIELGVFQLPLHIILNTGPGLWMILCYSLFQEAKKIPRWLLGIVGLQICLSALKPFLSSDLSDIDITNIGNVNDFIFGSLPLFMEFLFSLGALFWIIKGWQADLVENRRLLRWILLGILSVTYFGGTLSQLMLIGADEAVRLSSENNTTLFAAIFFTMLALICLRFDATIFDQVTDVVKPEEISDDDFSFNADLKNFQRVFLDQRSYLEHGLSIADLANKLAMPQYKLRALINGKLGYRNFNVLLNKYRIKDACEQFSDPEKAHLPILTVALSVGYQSIAPFNKAFRQMKGITPSEFRKQIERPST